MQVVLRIFILQIIASFLGLFVWNPVFRMYRAEQIESHTTKEITQGREKFPSVYVHKISRLMH